MQAKSRSVQPPFRSAPARLSTAAVALPCRPPVWPGYGADMRERPCSRSAAFFHVEHGLTDGINLTSRIRGSRLALPILALAGALALSACGGKGDTKSVSEPTSVTSIGVNAYLWRAALDTMQFMPLAQVDSAGGVIIGDWYQNPAVPNERVKVTVAILDGAMRADAVQVSAQREVLENGRWMAAPVRAGTVQRLEEIILEKARTLRQASLARN